ncbi:BLUF domain-containing protein [Sphingomonas sp. PAMC 26617]|uniref:BLUF domain-containing protein n=1 Tax=Sphingomonas sp. PAMC 26617 TaxID=1112216 RepID=UPI0009DA00B3
MEVLIVRNIKAGVTGMLWSQGANFAQVIKGSYDQVGATMDRILSDPRHTGAGPPAHIERRCAGNHPAVLAIRIACPRL